jgi:hypothetical protein
MVVYTSRKKGKQQIAGFYIYQEPPAINLDIFLLSRREAPLHLISSFISIFISQPPPPPATYTDLFFFFFFFLCYVKFLDTFLTFNMCIISCFFFSDFV